MKPEDLQKYVINPTLRYIGLNSKDAGSIVLGVAAAESKFEKLQQFNGGPAMGLWQMEPRTHDDIYDSVFPDHLILSKNVQSLLSESFPALDQLHWNLAYACAMCRVQLWRFPEALPRYDDISGQAHYWKKYYNTEDGSGTIEHYIESYYRLIIQR